MILLQIFTTCLSIFNRMSQFMRKLKKKMSGMEPKMKTTIIAKIRITIISSHQGVDTSSWEAAEEITK
jgi:hypothetical protein